MDPLAQRHCRQASHNESAAQSILDDGLFLDWSVTAAFYAALHYLQAYFVENGKNPKTHALRTKQIRSDPDLDTVVYFHYMHLSDDAYEARYNLKQFSAGPFTPREVKDEVLPSLEVVKKRVNQLLS